MALELLSERAVQLGSRTTVSWLSIGALVLASSLVSCGPQTPYCDSADYLWCSGGNVWLGSCRGSSIVAQCAKGCVMDEMRGGFNTCPLALCRENQLKREGESCDDASDCQPTAATVSTTAVDNTYLTCDAATRTCAPTDAPVVADWLAPCSPTLIADVAATNRTASGYDAVFPDPGCAEGWCAVHHDAGASCLANGCTRGCTGDHECPRGSTCAYAIPAGCSPYSWPAHCKPGGPAAIGFTCG